MTSGGQNLTQMTENILAQLARSGILPSGVSDDSRQVQRGDLFLAYPGGSADGRAYIEAAIERGACAVLWQPGDGFAWNARWPGVQWAVPELRTLCGPLAHRVLGQPSERLSLIAITGTNGKTTISQWLGLLHPRRCAVVGTLGAGFPGEMTETGFTTPEATTLTRALAGFVEAGAQACALEASSIGIEEGRLDGARVDVAVFTNLTRDHLDYHGSMTRYAQAKEKLLSWPRLRLAVINLDDSFGRQWAERTTASKIMGYTQQDEAGGLQCVIRAENVEETANGMRFRLSTPVGRVAVETGLLGRYNVSNLLAVAAVLLDAGMSPEEISSRFSTLGSPVGRLEKIGGEGEPLVVVDYAHTPDALESALVALRGIATARGGQLIAVFGCGGDRDRGKRPLMGAVAARLADRVILTSDNPRSEAPADIINDILAGVTAADVIVDRAEAIFQVVCAAAAADVILLAGKGHETYQDCAGIRQPFSDLNESRAALALRQERAK